MSKFYGVFKIDKNPQITHLSNKYYWNENSSLKFELSTDILFKEEEQAIEFISNTKEIGLSAIFPVYVTGLKDERGE